MANPAQSFQDDEENWGPSSQSKIAESATPDLRLIKTVRVVVHDNRKILIPDLNPLGLNHWTIFLVIEEDKAAVRMDMRAGSSNSKGDLCWKKLHYSIPNSRAKSWDWRVVGTDGVRGKGEGVCPEGVYELLLKHGFDRYRMHESGQGCRHWTWRAFNLLLREGWIEHNDKQDLKPLIEKYYPNDGTEIVASEMGEGKFYAEGEKEPESDLMAFLKQG